MVRNGIDVTPEIEQQIVHHEERGQTAVLAAINSEYIQGCQKQGGRPPHF